MSFGQASKALSLFGPQSPRAPHRAARALPGPQLDVRWGSFHHSFGSSIRALLTGPSASKKFLTGEFFRDCWIEGRVPRAAFVAAALWHIVFLVIPWPQMPARARKNPALENFQLSWSGPINDLPPLKISAPAVAAPSPRGDAAKPLASEGADAFHPRQRIFTDPAVPTHPRQTLVNTAAPAAPPKILPNLPNIVLMQQNSAPAKPRMEISEQMLAQLHPRERRAATAKTTPAPDVAAADGPTAEITLAPSANVPARPKLELNAGAAPRVARERAQSGDSGPAPELATQNSSANASTLIALSATPGPVAPAAPPQGNLAARVAISPEGKQPGVPGGNAAPTTNTNGGAGGAADSHGGANTGSTAGKSSTTAISISGGNPVPKSISGLGGNPQPKQDASPRGFSAKIDPRARIADGPERTGPPNFAALPPGAKPEQVFAAKKIYTLLVNMPNLNSATGSWILNFSELRSSGSAARVSPNDLAAPTPLKKSDPKYPPTLINEHVEGEVVLYAVIRADGSVDSVELVSGLDEQLDNNAMSALTQWKFTPASRQGTPVDLEAIVHIPFHAPANR
jgi:TonB family protein